MIYAMFAMIREGPEKTLNHSHSIINETGKPLI